MSIDAKLDFRTDLRKGAAHAVLRQPLFTQDSKAHTFSVEVTEGGSAASLTGAKCTGYFIRADRVTVPIDGSVSGNRASVTLLPACYEIPGAFELSLKVTLSGTIHTLLHAEGSVNVSRTDRITSGGGAVQSFDELVSAVQQSDNALHLRDRVYNHLDNTLFQIAQAGRNGLHGTRIYAADRWWINTWQAELQVRHSNGVMHLTGGAADVANSACLRQAIPADGLAGKTITASIEVTALVQAGGARLRLSNDGTASATAQTSAYTPIRSGVITVSMTVPADATTISVIIGNYGSSGGTGLIDFSFRHPALYTGAYTAASLPVYQPKGYAEELAQCQRYYVRTQGQGYGYGATATSVRLNIPVPVRMRTTPSVDDGLSFRVASGGTQSTVTQYAVNNMWPGVVQLTLTGTGFTPFAPVAGYSVSGEFGLSADL